jgi:hypothetical protein
LFALRKNLEKALPKICKSIQTSSSIVGEFVFETTHAFETTNETWMSGSMASQKTRNCTSWACGKNFEKHQL